LLHALVDSVAGKSLGRIGLSLKGLFFHANTMRGP
jgi:hypothetical protein